MAVSELLREREHDVVFCCGGTAREILETRGERVIPVPALRQVMRANQVMLGKTVQANWRTVLCAPRLVGNLADAFAAYAPDLLITDFEAFSPRAAQRLGVPVLSFNHQQVVTETRYDLPVRDWPQAAMTATAIRAIAPPRPAHVLLTSFFFPPLKNPQQTTLVPPIIRPAVQALEPDRGDHVLVYYNQTEGAGAVPDALRAIDASFVLYNFEPPGRPSDYPNLTFKEPSLDGFLEDLRTSRAVVCTAGFTLISEGLYLGKPLLVVPNRGIFEQTINAYFLQREGLGEAVIDRHLQTHDVRGFLSRLDTYETGLADYRACGNRDALACIERVLARSTGPSAAPSQVPSRAPALT